MTFRNVRRLVQRDAEDFDVRARTAWLVFWAPLGLTALFLTTLLHRPLFEVVTHEDSVLEWAQVIAFVTAGVTALMAAARLRRRDRLAMLLVTGFAALAFIAAGEEISWGQRIFDWETPAILGEINHQDETTVHNIVPVQRSLSYLQLLVGLYGGVVPAVLRSTWSRRPLAADVVLPAAFIAPAFLIMAGYRLVRLTLLTEDRFVLVKFGEMPELCLAFALAVTASMISRVARRQSSTSPGDERTVSTQVGNGGPPSDRAAAGATP